MDLEGTVLGTLSKTQKEQYCTISLMIWNLKQQQQQKPSSEIENRLMVARSRKRRGPEGTTHK